MGEQESASWITSTVAKAAGFTEKEAGIRACARQYVKDGLEKKLVSDANCGKTFVSIGGRCSRCVFLGSELHETLDIFAVSFSSRSTLGKKQAKPG